MSTIDLDSRESSVSAFSLNTSDTYEAPSSALPCKTSYIYRLQALIQKMTAQLGRLSEESHQSMATKKKEYRFSSEKAATIHEKIGNIAPYGTGAALAFQMTAASVALLVETKVFPERAAYAKPICNWIAEHAIPGGVGIYTHQEQAQEQRYNSQAAIRQIDVQNEGNKSGDSVSISTVLGDLSRALRDGLAAASR